jgi:nifR3 family TIM-barrel protein
MIRKWETGTVTQGHEPLRIGSLELSHPVVLAPMAGVTNAPFRQLCRRYGGALYVSEMVMARALLERTPRTMRMIHFGPNETPRSLQLYGTEPVSLGEAVRRLVAGGEVDHIDMNFGCPAPKVTRNGGGSAVPVKRALFRSIVRAAVQAAYAESGGRVPVTIKFRKGINDDLLTFLEAGTIGEEEGVAAVSLHARTAEQLYSGDADWNAIGELKQAVTSIPVLGNGDIWEASDALRMMEQTGCDGVVVGRGCLGRPWLFGDLVAAFEGKEVPPPPPLGEVMETMREHAALLVEHFNGLPLSRHRGPEPGSEEAAQHEASGNGKGIRDFRKHAGWYMTGYAVGPDMRRRLGMVSSLPELDDLLTEMDPTLELVEGGRRFKRGHTNGPKPVRLPEGYLNDRDDPTPPSVEAEIAGGSGG